ncbi:MAG: glucosaminidase domain-containing protein [bacterium]|jgi:LysM repeat protein
MIRPFLFVLLLLPILLPGQDRISTEEYIEMYQDIAVRKMKEYGIPASITLAQGILESGSGNSRLAREANNHFGIKCHKDWTGKTYTMDDDEKDECFRKYKDPEDSFRDHSLFLTQRGRYSFLFDYDITDYKSWARGLKKAGYATNPKYPQLLISIIERYELNAFDTGQSRSRRDARTEERESAEKQLSFADLATDKAVLYESDKGRKVYENNGVPFIVVEDGDTYAEIAEEFDIYSWQLYKYNELGKKHKLKSGEILYLEKKRRKAAREFKTHTVSYGENLRYISQLYGVRMKRLAKMNDLYTNSNLPVGSKLRLR